MGGAAADAATTMVGIVTEADKAAEAAGDNVAVAVNATGEVSVDDRQIMPVTEKASFTGMENPVGGAYGRKPSYAGCTQGRRPG
ncbi:MAG: hypothetical protein CBB71_00870 [Rhodopirellula sp. TMED11]|nr:MAG: hypothetical protein CBB71_00870 [Rhodopirellula sp. TMED11]